MILRIILFPIKLPFFIFICFCSPFMVTIDNLTTADENFNWDKKFVEEIRKAASVF